MNKLVLLTGLCFLISSSKNIHGMPECYKEVDQVIWVVSDLENTIKNYQELGFNQVMNLGEIDVSCKIENQEATVKLARANLAGAIVNWIQPMEGNSLFHNLLKEHHDAAVGLVHRFSDKKEQNLESKRLNELGIKVLEKVTLHTPKGDLDFTFMDTEEKGKYILGFTNDHDPMDINKNLSSDNRHNMKLNQYAFAIRNPDPVSDFWEKMGFPAFQINYPELDNPIYYGEPADHELIQGWQRHGTIAYEWCIPVKPPIVYEDHIKKHGEGIHHLAFSVDDMDEVLDDFRSRGFVVSMGGTWGEKGKPGFGRYEYIDLEEAGGLTMELLWNYKE